MVKNKKSYYYYYYLSLVISDKSKIQHFMFLRLYEVNRRTIQFHEKLLPAQGKLDKCFQTIKELGWFLFFSSELPYKSLFTEERNRTFHIGLDKY